MSAIRKERTEWLVGLFVFFGLAIMGTLIVQFGRFSDRLQEKYEIEITFPDASGIREGSPVTLAGQKVGYVAEEPRLNEDFTGVSVPLYIYGEKRIPIGSKFTIGTSGLMGDTFIKVEMPDDPKPEYLVQGDQVEGSDSSGLESLQQDAGFVMADLRLVIADTRQAVQRFDGMLEKIDEGLLSEENSENLRGTFEEFRKAGENLNNVAAKLDPLVEDAREAVSEAKTTLAKAGDAMGKVESTFEKAEGVIEKAEPAVEDLEPTLAELRATIENANRAITELSEGDGVAAALINDSGLREDLESFADKIERYGVLGYPKDKERPSSSRKTAERKDSEGESTSASEPAERDGPFKFLFRGKR